MDQEPDLQRKRAAFLSTLLASLVLCVLVGWMVLICGAAAIDFLSVVGGLTLLGLVNYLLWGRFLNKAVAGEREEDVIRRRMEEESLDTDPLGHQRRF